MTKISFSGTTLAICIVSILTSCSSVSSSTDVDTDSTVPGYERITITSMGVSLDLPTGWMQKTSSEPVTSVVYTDQFEQRNLHIQKTPLSTDFTAALASMDSEAATGYEGQESVHIDTQSVVTIAGTPAIFRERTLVAAGMKDIGIFFRLGNSMISISLYHEDGAAPSSEDKEFLEKIASSMQQL